jgi:hypothetical protein
MRRIVVNWLHLTAPQKEKNMTKLVVVCLGVVVLWTAVAGATYPSESFGLADRVGEPNARRFFLFSTSAGKYTIREDGTGELSSPKVRRRVFMLKLGAKGRIERVYFLEHEGDLFLLYEVHDATSQWAYLLRMEQRKKKARWLTSINTEVAAPMIEGDLVIVNGLRISKANGSLGQD